MSTTDLPVLNHNPGPSPIRPLQADGWVVVSRLQNARMPTYEWYASLVDAIEEYRHLAAGSTWKPLSLFPVYGGLPIGGPLSDEALARLL